MRGPHTFYAPHCLAAPQTFSYSSISIAMRNQRKKAMLPVFTGLVKEGGAKVTQEIGFLEGFVLSDLFCQDTSNVCE